MAISRARQFFDEIVAGGTPAIEALVTNAQHETEWVDFKGGDQLSEDAKTWSEAVCGFANNQGGVLIWGIDARKDKATHIDAASALNPVQAPAKLRSRLIELLRSAVEPPLTGVDIQEFHQTGESGDGYVVCFVPESDTKPHRAESVKNKPYLIRIADAFINPSPSLLRSLFYPKSSALLEAEVAAYWPDAGVNPVAMITAKFAVTIRNIGIISAKDIYVSLRTVPIGLKVDQATDSRVVQEEEKAGVEYLRPLHPSASATVCIIRFPVNTMYQHSGAGVRYIPKMEPLEILLDLYAADMIPLKFGVAFGDREVAERRTKKALPRRS
jgi:hypothetical protein